MDTDIENIAAWLIERASAASIVAKPHPELARRDDNWIYFPVRIEGEMGAFERAERLQDLEEKWEAENTGAGIQLLLVPAAA